MDPLHLAIALTPLTLYFVWVGFLNLRRRPSVVNGFRDITLLCLGISGCAIAGPLELFFPEIAPYENGLITWLLLVGMYLLLVTLIVLLMRPRLIIYNLSAEELRSVINGAAIPLDPQSRWTGDSFLMPNLGVHLHVERHALMRTLQLISSGSAQSIEGWRRLEKEIRGELREKKSRPGIAGMVLCSIATLMVALVAWSLTRDDYSVVTAFREMLRIY